jgi:hypothetical protein
MIESLERIRQSPRGRGRVEMLLRRPEPGMREVLEEIEFCLSEGVRGDNWSRKPSSRTPDRSPHPDMQVNIMNVRVLAAICPDREKWQLAGDQLIVDLDLSEDHLPAGTRLGLGTAVLQVTAQPHTGCKKFAERFGLEAHKFVNSAEHRRLKLRGINARVVQAGRCASGAEIFVL